MAKIGWRRLQKSSGGYDEDMVVHMAKIWRWRCEDLAVMEMAETWCGDGEESVLYMPMISWRDGEDLMMDMAKMWRWICRDMVCHSVLLNAYLFIYMWVFFFLFRE